MSPPAWIRVAVVAAMAAACRSGSEPAEASLAAPDPAMAGADAPDSAHGPADSEGRRGAQPVAETETGPEAESESETDPLSLGPEASTSIGTPVEGHLEGSVALPLRGRGYAFHPSKDPARRFGTVELVQALLRAAAHVERELPGGTLVVGDIALVNGGSIGGHASHRSGRDVDVMFFLLDEHGNPRASKAIPLDPKGKGHDYQDLTTAEDDLPVSLDVARTWAFVEALVRDPSAHINRIFVVEHVRRLLLDHAKRSGAPTAAMARFGDLTCQPGFPHDDHLHIRFFCSADDIGAGCRDTRPVYPWHKAHLAETGTKAVMAGARTTKRPKLTSVEEARTKVAASVELHPDVVAFLDARRKWAKKPHPRRKYCR